MITANIMEKPSLLVLLKNIRSTPKSAIMTVKLTVPIAVNALATHVRKSQLMLPNALNAPISNPANVVSSQLPMEAAASMEFIYTPFPRYLRNMPTP